MSKPFELLPEQPREHEGKLIAEMQWNETRAAIRKVYGDVHKHKALVKLDPTPEAKAALSAARALNAALQRRLSWLDLNHMREKWPQNRYE